MRIVTLTLNPAFDLHCYTESFVPFRENQATITSCDAGGKGVNISRTLCANGIKNRALIVLGEENGDSFLRALDAERISFYAIMTEGRIRENMTLHTPDNKETRISFAGFCADDSLIDRVEKELSGIVYGDTVLTVSGKNPDGVSTERIIEMMKKFTAMGVKIVIDSRSFGAEDLSRVRPWLIKPNEEEVTVYTGIRADDTESAVRAAKLLYEKCADNVLITLGARGAVLACDEGMFTASAPSVRAISTVGAGDSAIGGFCAAAMKSLGKEEMLRYAVGYGSAACLTDGTSPPRPDDIAELLPLVKVTHLQKG